MISRIIAGALAGKNLCIETKEELNSIVVNLVPQFAVGCSEKVDVGVQMSNHALCPDYGMHSFLVHVCVWSLCYVLL